MTHLHRVGASFDDHPANAIFLLDKGSEIDPLDLVRCNQRVFE